MSFIGAVSASVRKVLAEYARNVLLPPLIVGAGNFTVPSVLRSGGYAGPITACDVTLYTSALGCYLTDKELGAEEKEDCPPQLRGLLRTSTPLELADFGLASQLGQVAGVAGELTPPADFWWALAGVLISTAVLFLLRRLLRLTGPRVRFLSVSLSLMVLVQLFSPIGSKLVGDLFVVDVYARMPAANNNRFHGLTIALWRSAVLQDTPAPEGYGPEYMESVLAEIDSLLAENGYVPAEESASAGDAETPNVIFILSEAFFDITRLPDITYASDPLANFHALRSEGVSGTFHSHYLGYGTGYIEMAMQYGVNNLDFGASTNLCFLENGEYEKFDALAEQFTKADGYRAQMLHGYNDSLYNRTVTYPLLGYEELFFSADVQKLGFPWDEGVYGGYYLRDDYL